MDALAELRWTTLVGIMAALTVMLMVINAIAGDPLISSTYAISAPIVLLLFLVAQVVAKRTRGRGPGNEEGDSR